MYHVIGTGLAAIILYLISYLFCQAGYFSLKFHRRIWNTILAISFILTAVAGLFLALQISYKWDIPSIKQILKIHVESGIGMAFTAIFHFIWHLGYFGKQVDAKPTEKKALKYPGYDSGKIKENLFIVGFTSTTVQILLMREVLIISGGYEIVSGIYLGAWLTGSALGARIAYFSRQNDIKKINVLFSITPVISIILMFLLAKLFLTSGETPSILVSIIFTFIVLLPFALVSGVTFLKLLMAARSADDIQPGNSFSAETYGGVFSGVLISVLTAGLLNTYQILLTLLILSGTWVVLTYYIKTLRTKLAIKCFAAIICSALILFNADIFFRQILLEGIEVTDTEDSPYGNVTRGVYGGETSTYYNQRLLSYSDDAAEREENIHFALLQCKLPESVIMISGSLASNYRELLKYPVKHLTYIETDPLLAKTISLSGSSTRITTEIIKKDAFRYMRKGGDPADAIILLVPPPSTMQLNRYFSVEFFTSSRARLKKGGVFVCTPGPAETYYNSEEIRLYSSVYNSLLYVFKHVIPVAGNKLYFIASDNDLSTDFCRLAGEKGINNNWVNTDFLSDDLTAAKSEEIISLIDKDIKVNRVSSPVATFHYQLFNLSRNRNEKAPSVVLMIMLFALPALSVKKRHTAMYFSASALAGFEVIILLTLQITAGNIYNLTGLVIAGIMTGLAIGAGNDLSFLRPHSPVLKMVLLIAFYAFFGLAYSFVSNMNGGGLSVTVLIAFATLPSIITGNIFRHLASGTNDPENSSLVYSADLAGSAAGFLLMAGVVMPAFGITTAITLLGVLIIAGLVFGTIGNN
jgi:spermidine synthase